MNFKNIEGGDDRQIGNLARQSSIYTLTFDEFQNTLGGPGKDFGSMNMEEFLKNIWTAEEMQAMVSSMGSVVEPSSTGGALQRQGSLTLPRTLSQKTVDEVWRDLYQGSSEKDVNAMAGSNFQQQQQTLGEITLEEFLVKAGVVREDTQIAARPNNSSEFYSELSQSNNNGAALPFGYQQLNQSSNRLDGIGAIDNKATICNISQMTNKSQQLPINVDGVAARQQIFLNQTTVSYGPSMHTVEASNPSMRGTTISESMIGNGLGQGVATVAGAPARAGGVDLGNVTTRPPNRLTFDGIGKRNRDSSSLSPVPYIFSGSLRGRRCSGAVEKVVERRQRRMIKNRESAARSRARKQVYLLLVAFVA